MTEVENNKNPPTSSASRPHVTQVVRGKHLRAIDLLDSRTWTELEQVAGWHDDKQTLLSDAVARLDKLDEAVKTYSARVKKAEKKINENEQIFLKYSKEGERLFRSATAFGLRLGNFIDPHSPDHRIAERVLLIALDMTDPRTGPLKFEQGFNLRLRAVALNNLATVLAQAKRFVEAIERVRMARAVEAELGPAAESPATTMFNEAQIYYLAGRTVDALQAFHSTSQVLRQHLNKSLGNKEKATNGGLLLAALRQLAGICEVTHRYQDAIATLEDALALARQVEKASLHMPDGGDDHHQAKASDVLTREYAGRKMTAVREAIAADLKRCQSALDHARNRPRGRIEIVELPKPMTFEEEAILEKQDLAMRKKKFGPRSAAVLHHHQDWTKSPAVLGGGVSCVAEVEILKWTKRSTPSPPARRHSPSSTNHNNNNNNNNNNKNDDDVDELTNEKSIAKQDKALAKILAGGAVGAEVKNSNLKNENNNNALKSQNVNIANNNNNNNNNNQQQNQQKRPVSAKNSSSTMSASSLTLQSARNIYDPSLLPPPPAPSSSSVGASMANKNHHQTAIIAAAADKVLSADYSIKSQVPVPVTSMNELVRSLPKNLQAAYLELQSKQPKNIAAIDPNSGITLPSLASQFDFDATDVPTPAIFGGNNNNNLQQNQKQSSLVVRPPKKSLVSDDADLMDAVLTRISSSRQQSQQLHESLEQKQNGNQQALPDLSNFDYRDEMGATSNHSHSRPPSAQSLHQQARPTSSNSNNNDNVNRAPTPPSSSSQQPLPSTNVLASSSGNVSPSSTNNLYNSPRPNLPVGGSTSSLKAASSGFVPPRPPSAASGSNLNASRPARRPSSSLSSTRNLVSTYGSKAELSSTNAGSPLGATFSATAGNNRAKGKPRSYQPRSVEDIMNQTFSPARGGGSGGGGGGASNGRYQNSAERGQKRKQSEAYQADIQSAAAEMARQWKFEEEQRALSEAAKKKSKFSQNQAATIVSRFLRARPCRVMTIKKQDEFLEKQVRLLVSDQRRSAILLAREEMQNTAMAKAATDFVSVWSKLQLNKTARTHQMKDAADKAEQLLQQRKQSREIFLDRAKAVMDRLEKTELALSAKSSDHAEFIRRDTVTKFLQRAEGVRMMQALLRAVGSIEVRAEHYFVALTDELARVRDHNLRVAMVTRLQNWIRRRLSLEFRKKVARDRRAAKIAQLTEFHRLFSRFLFYHDSVSQVFKRKVEIFSRNFAKFGAVIRGVSLRKKLPFIRWEHERFLERKRLQSALIIVHAWQFFKFLKEFSDPFQGISKEEVDEGRIQFAATRIQSRFRSHLYGKPHAKRLNEVRAKKAEDWHIFIAAVSIQRWWARAKANTALRRIKQKEAEIKRVYLNRELVRWAGNVVLKFLRWASKKLRDDAIMSWEAELAKKNYITCETHRRQVCATKIQRGWRDHNDYRHQVVSGFEANPPVGLLLRVDDSRSANAANDIIATRVDVLREANLNLMRGSNNMNNNNNNSSSRRRLSEQNMLSERSDHHHQTAIHSSGPSRNGSSSLPVLQDDDDDDVEEVVLHLHEQEENIKMKMLMINQNNTNKDASCAKNTETSEEEQNTRATDIQRVFRGFLARKFVREVVADAVVSRSTGNLSPDRKADGTYQRTPAHDLDDDDETHNQMM